LSSDKLRLSDGPRRAANQPTPAGIEGGKNDSFYVDGGRIGRSPDDKLGGPGQVAPNPNNPNDTVADTFTPPPYGETINL
jgi:hypothetical protein